MEFLKMNFWSNFVVFCLVKCIYSFNKSPDEDTCLKRVKSAHNESKSNAFSTLNLQALCRREHHWKEQLNVLNRTRDITRQPNVLLESFPICREKK